MVTSRAAGESIVCRSFQTHKQDEDMQSCQDAADGNAQAGRYAIADGATQSFFPREWAKLLVHHFCHNGADGKPFSFLNKNWKDWLDPIQREWYKTIEREVKEQPKYYNTNRFTLREPAISTFIGLELSGGEQEETRWQAMIIGDSCLFHLSDSKLTSYPLNHPNQFTARTPYFASYASRNKDFEPKFVDGNAGKSDTIFMATDALAKWILLQYQAGCTSWQACWQRLSQITSDKEFQDFVQEKRQSGSNRLENDDTTLLLISFNQFANVSKTAPTGNSKELEISNAGQQPGLQGEKDERRTTESQPPTLPRKPDSSNVDRALALLLSRTEALERTGFFNRIMASVAAGLAIISLAISSQVLFHNRTHDSSTQRTPQPPPSPSVTPTGPSGTTPPPHSPPATVTEMDLSKGTPVYEKPDGPEMLILATEVKAKPIHPSEGKDKKDAWIEIKLQGWVSSTLVHENGNTVTVKPGVNIRTGPSTQSSVLGQPKQVQSFEKLEVEQGWLRVAIQGAIKK
ncbi:MAG TPA: SH3 domain-containing protein [Candidatus Angelobacter sp.]|nr:SH3 domain-containing protein [Candidatus Angelobacter sp.]